MKRFFNFIPASPTSLRFKYRDEAALLAKSLNPEQEYVEHVLPDKIKLAKEYVKKSSFLFDLGLILRTPLRLFT